ncbi:hypothetical protein ACVWWO_003645 [Bradyrhizobium sp. F1.13.1]
MGQVPPLPFRCNAATDEGKEAEQMPRVSAESSETWWDGVYGYREEHWVPFDPDRPERPDSPEADGPMGNDDSRDGPRKRGHLGTMWAFTGKCEALQQ